MLAGAQQRIFCFHSLLWQTVQLSETVTYAYTLHKTYHSSLWLCCTLCLRIPVLDCLIRHQLIFYNVWYMQSYFTSPINFSFLCYSLAVNFYFHIIVVLHTGILVSVQI